MKKLFCTVTYKTLYIAYRISVKYNQHFAYIFIQKLLPSITVILTIYTRIQNIIILNIVVLFCDQDNAKIKT